MEPLKLSDLSIEQKIGQMMVCRGFRPNILNNKPYILDMIRNRALGAIQLDRPGLEIREALEVADYPILVCANMEYGYGRGKIQLPCPMAVGALDSEQMAYEFGRLTAVEARAAGYNLVFGPIVDIAMNPLSSCVGPRAFGGDKKLVARMATASIRGYQDQGMIVTAKHYPGFGESPVDSHIGMVTLSCDRDLLIERELYPYLEAMRKADLSGVMVGHIMVPKIDPTYPATISRKLIGILREAGFDGLVMTDSFAMVGMTNRFGLEECHGLAMAAGNDMVMPSYRLTTRTAYEWMLKACREGVVSEEQVDAAVTRVLAAQAKTLRKPTHRKLTQKDEKLARTMSRECITAVLAGVPSPAIPTNKKHLFILQVPNRFVDPETGKKQKESGSVEVVEAAIRKLFPKSDLHHVNDFPSFVQVEAALDKSMQYETVVPVVYSRTSSYVGSSDLTRRMLAMIEGFAHKVPAVVVFGNAYAARELPPVPRVILGYEGGYCEESAIQVLAGKRPAHGKLPIPVRFRGE